MLRATNLTHQRVDAGQWIAVDGPKVKPSAGRSGDVAHRTILILVADESQPRQIPDDGRSIPRSRHKDVITRRCRQTSDGLRVAVRVLLDSELLLAQIPNGDDRIGTSRHSSTSSWTDASQNLLMERSLANHQGLVGIVRYQADRMIGVSPGHAASKKKSLRKTFSFLLFSAITIRIA